MAGPPALLAARAQVRTAALAAELLQLGVSGGLLVGEAAAAVSIGDGLLFKGSEGAAEAVAVACLTSIPMVSAFAAALLCCDPSSASGSGTVSSGLARTFQVLAALAILEVIFLCITGVFQPSMHALAWPLAVAVCFSRAAVAWSTRVLPAATASSRPGPVGVRPPRLLRKTNVAEKSQQTELKVKLQFPELDFDEMQTSEEWTEKLLQHFRRDQGISAEICDHLQIELAQGVVEILVPPEAQEVVAVLEAPPNPVVLSYQGTDAFANISVLGKGHAFAQRKCAIATTAMSQVKRLQEQLQNELQSMMTSCRQSIQDLDGKVQTLEDDTAEQQRRVQSLEAKAKLQLRLAQSELPREMPRVARDPDVSPEAVAAMAKRLVERTRKDLEAQMAVLQHQFGQVSRELESLTRAAALVRAGECDASARTLRKYLVDALVRPSTLEEAQHLALRLLSQALDAATLLSAHALAPKSEAKAPVEIFAKYESTVETRRIHEELLTQRLQELLAAGVSDAATALHPHPLHPLHPSPTDTLDKPSKMPEEGPTSPKFLPPMPIGFRGEGTDSPPSSDGFAP